MTESPKYRPKPNRLFRLKNDYEGTSAGFILLQGDTSDEGTEYFNMTTEINEGVSYSHYDVPVELLEASPEEDYDTVEKFFRKIWQSE